MWSEAESTAEAQNRDKFGKSWAEFMQYIHKRTVMSVSWFLWPMRRSRFISE